MSERRVRYTDTELLDAVRAVALLAAPDAPEELSQPQFDARRREVADTYPDLPTARAIYMRLNSGTSGSVSWSSLVRGALVGGSAQRQTIVAARRGSPGVPLSERVVFFALNLVAKEIDSDAPSPDQYDAAADRLRRTRRGALAKMLPTSGQLAQFAGGWNEALLLAQLRPRNGRADVGQVPRQRSKPATVPVSDAIGFFIESQGCLPARGDLRWFASAAGFALADDKRRPWEAHLADTRRKWSALGRWFPRGLPRVADRVRYQPRAEDLPPDLPVRVRDRWSDLDACAAALNAYWDTLPAGKEPKQKSYGAWAVGREDAPAPSRFLQHGGFGAVREYARSLRRQRRGTQMRAPIVGP